MSGGHAKFLVDIGYGSGVIPENRGGGGGGKRDKPPGG